MRKATGLCRWMFTACLICSACSGRAFAETPTAAHAESPKAPVAPKPPQAPAMPQVAAPPAADVAKKEAAPKPNAAATPEGSAKPINAAATAAPPPATATTSATPDAAPKEPAAQKRRAERPSSNVHSADQKAVERKDSAPPSLTLEALHAEISNSPAEIERNNLLKERERIGELAGALDIAQKQLRQDTERLAAYLDEVRKQTEEIKGKRQSEKEAATKAETAAKAAKPSTGPQPPMPLEVLAKAMKGMKPAQAAAIADRLPLVLAGDVMERMPSRDAGKVMGLMNPERAAALASEIASREDRRKRATQ